jgi:microtubule-associated protein-like 6
MAFPALVKGVHPDRRTVATGQAGKDPDVIVWDSADCTELQRLPQGYGNRGVTACCFSPDGTKLVCICTDNNHTMYIWDWKKKKVDTLNACRAHALMPVTLFFPFA